MRHAGRCLRFATKIPVNAVLDEPFLRQVVRSIVTPSLLPIGLIANGLANNAFTMTVAGGATAATVAVNTAAGSATLVYQVDLTNEVLTVSPVDITTAAGLAAFTTGLAVGAPVKVYGVPQADGTLRAYVLTYYTGQIPAQSN